MSRHHKLVYGSLFVFVAATHVGCAGSGLKNMFTRNETDGYQSLDELESAEKSVAETEISEDEVAKPSVVTRLASWRPFSKTEPTQEEPLAATGGDSSDAEETGTKPRFLGRGLTKRESVEPDPFLSAESTHVNGSESLSVDAVTHQEIEPIDDESKQADEEFAFKASPKPRSAKGATTSSRRGQLQADSTAVDTNAVALGASRKVHSTESSNADEDDLLAKEFEQHFLITSRVAVAKHKTDAVAIGNDLRQKISRAESEKRELSESAARRINQFDFLLSSDSDSEGTSSELGPNPAIEPLQGLKGNASTAEKSENSLTAFEQLIGTEGSDAASDETEVTHTVAGKRKQVSPQDIDVADAEALFGAAAVRQNTRVLKSEMAHRAELSDRHADRSNPWSPASENSEEFEGEDSQLEKQGSSSNDNQVDVARAFARHLSDSGGKGKARIHNTAFGAPMTSAGNVEDVDDSAQETPDMRLRESAAFSHAPRIAMTNYGTDRPPVIREALATETATSGDPLFTAAPLAPIPVETSVSEVTSTTTRLGLVQSFSTRNWLLLIGGVIVIALLFAPGRTKPLTVNSRPVNG